MEAVKIYNQEEVDQMIINYAGKMPVIEMVSISGRSDNYVRLRANRLGITLRMDSELKQFIRLNYKTFTCLEVAEKFKVKKGLCYTIARRLGVEFKAPHDNVEIGEVHFDRNGFFDETAYAKYCII